MKIDQQIIDILAVSRAEANRFFLPDKQLDRATYVKVNKVLENIGLKWDKKAKCHVSEDDVETVLSQIIDTGEYEYENRKKEIQFFPTPASIVKQLVDLAEIKPTDIVLETSAGQGAILDGIIGKIKEIFVFEIDEQNCHCLAAKDYDFKKQDFLSFNDDIKIDKVVQNPPFHLKGRPHADVDFILHAWKFLKPGGILVSVVSESPFFRTDKQSESFRNWLTENKAQVISLEAGAFKESGTMIKTRIIKVVKPKE